MCVGGFDGHTVVTDEVNWMNVFCPLNVFVSYRCTDDCTIGWFRSKGFKSYPWGQKGLDPMCIMESQKGAFP